MAARKSCTHLTWAEAKSKVGGSSSTKKPLIPKKIDHGKALTAKVIAKNGASQAVKSKEKTLLKRLKRDEERALAAAEKRKEEKERERRERFVKPFDQAMERIRELAMKLQNEERGEVASSDFDDDGGIINEKLLHIAECRELQVNEVMGLDAIYADTDAFRISNLSDLEKLQELIENWQMDEENEALLQDIARHPPTSFTLQMTVDGMCEGSDLEIAASLLLRVILPNVYPLDESSMPTFEIISFIATDREAVCNPDKPLESLAFLEDSILKGAMEQEVKGVLPDPCVYEVVNTCLMERLFEFVKMSQHAQYAKNN